MNKALAGLMLATALLLPSVSFAAFDSNLQYGSKGDSVLELQEFLTSEGVYSGPISGNFFSLTRAGVIALQAKYGITPAAGFFGPVTRAKANSVLAVQDSAEQAQAVAETGTTSSITTVRTASVNSFSTPTMSSSATQSPEVSKVSITNKLSGTVSDSAVTLVSFNVTPIDSDGYFTTGPITVSDSKGVSHAAVVSASDSSGRDSGNRYRVQDGSTRHFEAKLNNLPSGDYTYSISSLGTEEGFSADYYYQGGEATLPLTGSFSVE